MKKFARDEIEKKVGEIIADHLVNVKPADIRPDDKLMADLGADSIDAVEIDIDLEKTFFINIPDEDFYILKEMSVKELCDLVERLQNDNH